MDDLKTKKALIISTVSRQFYLFEQANIEIMKSLNYEVHGAANFHDANERLDQIDIIRHHFDIQRNPLSLKNIKALFQLKNIVKNGGFDVIHCHSPMGGVLGRFVAKFLSVKTIIYTAHGFHFFKGSPKINWIIYFPIEKFLSRFTDILITINQEDYHIAKTFFAQKVIQLPGIGVDFSRFKLSAFYPEKKRTSLNIGSNTTVILSIGELIPRKNYKTALRALANIRDMDFVYVICGVGILDDELKEEVKRSGLESKTIFLGFRNDIPEICLMSDIFFFPSKQEGLPVSVMEAMGASLPVVCSVIRGNTDLIHDGLGGYTHDPNDTEAFSESLKQLISDEKLRSRMGAYNYQESGKYDKVNVNIMMHDVYADLKKDIL